MRKWKFFDSTPWAPMDFLEKFMKSFDSTSEENFILPQTPSEADLTEKKRGLKTGQEFPL